MLLDLCFLKKQLQQVIVGKQAQGYQTAGLLTKLHKIESYDALAALAQAVLAKTGEVLLVDCHSMPASATAHVAPPGSGPVDGYGFSIDHQGVRVTTAHPKGVPSTNCWSMKGTTCDT